MAQILDPIDPGDPPADTFIPYITWIENKNPKFGETFTVTGSNFLEGLSGVDRVTIGGQSVVFEVLGNDSMLVTASKQSASGVMSVRNSNGTSYTSTINGVVTVQTVAITPSSGLSDGPDTVICGQTLQLSATVSGAADGSVRWSTQGGTISSITPAGTPAIWLVPSIPGSYKVTAAANADSLKNCSRTFTVVPGPSITDITSEIGFNPPYGGNADFTPIFQNGTGVVSAPGSPLEPFSVISGQKYYIGAITAARGITLVVSQAGATASMSKTWTPQTVGMSAIQSTGSTPEVVGRKVSFYATVTGAADTRIGWSVSGGTLNKTMTSAGDPLVEWTLPTTPGSYTISAQSSAGSLHRIFNQEVVAVPTAVLTASTLNPLYGTSVSLTTIFSHGVGFLDGVLNAGDIGTVASGGVYATSGVMTPQSYRLVVSYQGTVANTSELITINPQIPVVTLAAPVKSTLTVSRNTVTLGASLTGVADPKLVWTCSSPSVNLTVSGDINETCLVTPLTPGTATIRVASLVYPQFYDEITLTVYGNPVALLTANPLIVPKGSSSQLTVVAAQHGTAVVNQGIGAVSQGTVFSSTPITTAKAYTLTVTNPEGYISTSVVTIKPSDSLAGSGQGTTTASSPNLTVRTQFKATGVARTSSWGALGAGIWLRGSNASVSPNTGQGHLSTQIWLNGSALSTTTATGNVSAWVSLAAQGVNSITGFGSLSVLKPIRYGLHVPRVYLDLDPDGLMKKLLNTLDQVLGDTLGDVALYPQSLVHASTTKFVQELLEHYGNPFKFQVDETSAKLLVNDLPHIYAQRGTLLGVKRAILYLLKRDIGILDFATVAWRLGISELELTTILGGIQGTMVYWVDVPVDYTPHQVRNLKAIVEFMAPLSIQIRYISFS